MIQNTGKKEYQALLNRTEKYAEQVRVLFANAVNDILSFSSSVPSLEDGEISLEDSFSYYEAGMRLVKQCGEKIDRVEKKVLQINESGGLDEF